MGPLQELQQSYNRLEKERPAVSRLPAGRSTTHREMPSPSRLSFRAPTKERESGGERDGAVRAALPSGCSRGLGPASDRDPRATSRSGAIARCPSRSIRAIRRYPPSAIIPCKVPAMCLGNACSEGVFHEGTICKLPKGTNFQRGSKSLPEINAHHVVGISPELTYFSISQYKC